MSALAKADVIALEWIKPGPVPALCPWEDAGAFGELQHAFSTSHRPDGPTEAALVERLTMIEWRRRRLIAAEAAVHVAHAFDRADEDTAKRKTLFRAGVDEWAGLANPHLVSIRLAWLTLHKTRDELVNVAGQLGDEMSANLIAQLGHSADWFKGLHEMLASAEARLVCAFAAQAVADQSGRI